MAHLQDSVNYCILFVPICLETYVGVSLKMTHSRMVIYLIYGQETLKCVPTMSSMFFVESGNRIDDWNSDLVSLLMHYEYKRNRA